MDGPAVGIHTATTRLVISDRWRRPHPSLTKTVKELEIGSWSGHNLTADLIVDRTLGNKSTNR